ncbi:hypothetical protein [Treponema zioleckii]|uniref:hypothetical protein n=1 Tax=Treponema zioleckii TaxID=331680 RepID=UPI00168AA782|nr:hypothetical protein [Treponema zioleckii]
MPMIKKAVFEYESTGKMNDRIRLDDENCIAYEWDPGFLGSWSAVVYSPANNLDAAVSSYEAGNLNEFRAYKSLLGGSLIRITKIEDSFYLCNFN